MVWIRELFVSFDAKQRLSVPGNTGLPLFDFKINIYS